LGGLSCLNCLGKIFLGCLCCLNSLGKILLGSLSCLEELSKLGSWGGEGEKRQEEEGDLHSGAGGWLLTYRMAAIEYKQIRREKRGGTIKQ
jgi:hypothetical protein